MRREVRTTEEEQKWWRVWEGDRAKKKKGVRTLVEQDHVRTRAHTPFTESKKQTPCHNKRSQEGA